MTTTTARIGIAICLGLLCAPGLAHRGFAQTTAAPNGTSGKPLPPVGSVGTTGTSTPSSAAVTPADYRLAPGDKLRVEVYKDAQLSQSLQIRPDGKVTLPLIGDIVATDLTPIQLRDRITNNLKEYITNPVVTVIVVEASPVMIYVMGEVATPGAIPMRGPMTVLQALAMAGGFKEFAKTKDIRIIRKGSGILKTPETIRFNYDDAVRNNGTPVLLQPGDMVVVP